MLKKILCGMIAGLMLMQTAITVGAVDYGVEYENQPTKSYSQVFPDVNKNHWAFSYIGEMNQRGVISGYPNGYYYPENNVTRAEFAKIMCVAAGLSISEVYHTSYDDVSPDDWFAPYVESGRHYLSGYSSNGEYYYHPNDKALREDIAVALVKLKGYSTVGADESILKAMFTDWQSISTDARKYVAAALENGLVSGYDDGTFRGQDSITRAEAATLLWRAYQYGNANKTFDVAEKEEAKPEIKKEQPTAVTETQKTEPEKQEVTEEKLPYYCDTLAMADISDSYSFSTFDGKDSIYYYDKTDKRIYKLSLKDKKKTSIFDASDFEYKDIEITEKEVTKQIPKTIKKTVEKTVETPEEMSSDEGTKTDEENAEDAPVVETEQSEEPISEKTEETVIEEIEETIYETVTETVKEEHVKGIYKDFKVEQVYYNQENDTLYMLGKFSKYAKDNALEDESKSFYGLFSMDGKNPTFICREYNQIRGTMEDGRLIIGDVNSWKYMLLNTNDLSKQYIQSECRDENSIIFMNNGSLYRNRYGTLSKYNFSKTNWVELTRVSNAEYTGIKNGYVYFWDVSKGKMAKSDLSGKIAYIDDFDSKNGIEVLDLKDMPQYSGATKIMYISNKYGYVFYDVYNKCWRNINKQN